jgi:hypothetical protein
MPRDADELRKSVTAALLDTTAPVVVFDNLTGVVRSSVLESLLTDKTWSDRLLGQNRQVTVANDRLWMATGNNAAFGGDLARRLATVALNPPQANPYLRTDFKIENLDVWMLEHRGEMLAAFLIIARGWIVAGRPGKKVRVRQDSYAEWLRALRGMMQWAGFQGSFGGGTSTVSVSARRRRVAHVPSRAAQAFGTDLFTVKDIVERLGHDLYAMNGSHLDSAALPGDLPQKWALIRDGKDGGFRKSLGWWLRNHEGRYAGVQKRSWAPGRTARENSGHGVRGTLVDQAEVFPAYPYRISAGQRGGDDVEQLTRPAEIFGIKISWTATPRLG